MSPSKVAPVDPAKSLELPDVLPVFRSVRAVDAATCDDPSHCDTPVTPFEVLKLVLMLPFTIVRIMLFFVAVEQYWFAIFVLTLGVPTAAKQGKEPLGPARRKGIVCASRVYLRAALFCFGFWWIRVEGELVERDTAPVVIANHPSCIDPIVLLWLCAPSAVGAAEQVNIPVVSTIFRALQMIGVSRTDSASRDAARHAIAFRADLSSGLRWPKVLVFPEGTCNNQRSLCTFKRGAFDPLVPVQAVLIRYNMPRPAFNPVFVNWGPGLAGIILRLMSQPYNTLHVKLLPPHSVLPGEDAHGYADRVRGDFSYHLGIPLSLYSADDCKLEVLANTLGMGASSGTVRIEGIREVFGSAPVGTSAVRRHMRDFANKLGGSSSRGHPPADAVRVGLLGQGLGTEPVFKLLAPNGTVSFRVYLIGVALPAAVVFSHPQFLREVAWHSYSQVAGGVRSMDRDMQEEFLRACASAPADAESPAPSGELAAKLSEEEFTEWSVPLLPRFAACLTCPEVDEDHMSPAGSPRG